jgi:DMSO reductase anchor subunit
MNTSRIAIRDVALDNTLNQLAILASSVVRMVRGAGGQTMQIPYFLSNPKLRQVHLWMGLVALVVFLATGQYMDRWHDHLRTMEVTPRMLFRSNHIYLMWSGLLNLLLGLYFQPCRSRWMMWLQSLGSILILAGPLLLTWAFFSEAWLPVGLLRPYAKPAIYIAFGGTLVHGVAALMDGRLGRGDR